MTRIILICAALAWAGAATVAVAQEPPPFTGEKPSAKHANVRSFHHHAHHMLHSHHHHKAMAAGKASIASHPRNKKPLPQ
jgi:hypothetical protein